MNYIPIDNINLGGMSDSKYQGTEHSVSKLVGLDIHSEPGVVKAGQALTKDSGATITELVKAIVPSTDGNVYFFSADSGKVWGKNISTETYSLVHTTTPESGEAKCLGASEFDGYIYWATQDRLHRISLNDTDDWATNAVEDWAELNQIGDTNGGLYSYVLARDSITHTTDSDYNLQNSDFFTKTNTYIPQTSINESTAYSYSKKAPAGTYSVAMVNSIYAHKQQLGLWVNTEDAMTLKSVKLNIVDKGTGNWTVTIHDSADSSVGSKTITNASLTNGVYNEFTFSSPLSMTIGEEYHVHVTSTVADGQLRTKSLDPNNYTINGYPTAGSIGDQAGDIIAVAQWTSEWDTEKYVFNAKDTTLTAIDLYISDKASEDFTITLHDEDDTSVATKTLTNANITEGGFNLFTFASTVSLNKGKSYHIHVTTGSDYTGKLASLSYGGMQSVYAKLYNDGDANYHPMQIVNGNLYIGNENFVHVVEVEGSEHFFTPAALDIPAEHSIRSLGIFETDLIIGTYVSSDIAKSQVFRWNTWSASWSYDDTVEESGVNCFINGDNFIMAGVGNSGSLYYYDGGKLQLLRTIPGEYSLSKTAITYPNAQSYYKGTPLFGLSNTTGNPTEQGVYAIRRNLNNKLVLSLDYVISTGNTSNITIGAMAVVGDYLYVAWKDETSGTSYGVDAIDWSNRYDGAYLETRTMNPTGMFQNKYAVYIAEYTSLPSGTSIDMYYKLNNASSWTQLTTTVDAKRGHVRSNNILMGGDLQLKVVLNTSSNDTPILKQILVGVE